MVAYYRQLPAVEEAPDMAIVVPDRWFELREVPSLLDRGPFSELKRVFLRHLMAGPATVCPSSRLSYWE